MPDERKSHIREILIGLFVTVLGGILVVQYQERLHENKGGKGTETTLPPTSTNPQGVSSKPTNLPFEKSGDKTTIEQSVSRTDKDNPMPINKTEENKPIEANIEIEDKGLSIKIIDETTQKPVEGVSINFAGFSDVLTSNINGIFIIPKSIIEKRGEYNSVRTYFTRNGFEPVNFEIGLSEPQTFKINKSQ